MSPTCIVSIHSSICLRLGMLFPWQQSSHIQCLIHSHDLFIRNVLTLNSYIYIHKILLSLLVIFVVSHFHCPNKFKYLFMTGYVVVSMTTILVSNSHDLCIRNDLHWYTVPEFIKFTYYDGSYTLIR